MKALLNINDPSKNVIRDAWKTLGNKPGGKTVFSKIIGKAAPYTGTINAVVEDLRPGHSRVVMRDRPGLRNHLRSVHAVALANLAELAGNVALAYTLPTDARFIVAGFNMEYVKKARGRITGFGECPIIESNERQEYDVKVSLKDDTGEEVARATLRSLVGPKK